MNSIFHRVSIRKYEDRPVEAEKTEAILRAAMAAPSAKNQQPWEFYVVTDKELIHELAKCSPFAACARYAPNVIVSAYRAECEVPELAEVDLAISMENMWLETDAQGLGGVWLAIAPFDDRMDKVSALLKMPESLKPFALFSYGYPAETKPQQNRFKPERIHYIPE